MTQAIGNDAYDDCTVYFVATGGGGGHEMWTGCVAGALYYRAVASRVRADSGINGTNGIQHADSHVVRFVCALWVESDGDCLPVIAAICRLVVVVVAAVAIILR